MKVAKAIRNLGTHIDLGRLGMGVELGRGDDAETVHASFESEEEVRVAVGGDLCIGSVL